MSHRADGLNDIFEHDVTIRKKVITDGGSVNKTPTEDLDIVNKKYVDDTITSLFPIDHTDIGEITNIGTNTHAQIDTHLGSTANPHSVTIDQLTPTTTKGDIIVENGSNAVRLAVGTNTHVLTADSGESSGIKWAAASGGISNIVEDTTPQLGGDLDLNGHALDFPTTANISDVLDEDDMASDSATKLATQQSIKAYVDTALGADVTVLKATFDITANTSVIAAAGAGIKNKIVAISMHNNDADAADDTVVKITDGDAGTVLIGGATGAIYLVGRGGFFGLPMSAAHPWCETTANTALYINPVSGKRVSGAVWYIQEA